ncbi:MAG: ribonuclease HII [Acidobacteriia bacterium]|nr:ribonuclease HII [Terriglobia bacterium]
MHLRKHSRCSTCTSRYEEEIYRKGYSRVAGLDEVGRGALCGPVLAAAVILDPAHIPGGIDDSKKLSPDRREALCREIVGTALSWGVGQVGPEAIDQEDILKATRRAMALAVSRLSPSADFLLIDAIRLHSVDLPQKSIIKGDTLSVSIAAASIVAKVTRDNIMMEFDRLYPQYYFRQNKGYGTREHLESLRRFGPSPIHRKTFRPVFQMDIPFTHAED